MKLTGVTLLAPPFGGAAGTVTPPTPRPSGACGTDFLSRGAAWLAGRLKATAAQPVLYSDGTNSVELCATLGRKLLKLDDGAGGVRMEWTDADLILGAADLVLGGVTVTPARGHTAYLVLRGKLLTYEVMAYGGEPPWKWSDPYHTLIRVHLKLVKTEDA